MLRKFGKFVMYKLDFDQFSLHFLNIESLSGIEKMI